MKQKHAFEDLSVRDLPISGRTLTFGNEIMLADNIGIALQPDETSRFVLSPYPFKLNFTMALFCLRGRMLVRLNLKEYELNENDVLVALPGNIGECLSFHEDCQVALIAYPDTTLFNLMEASMAVRFRKYLSCTPVIHLLQKEMQDIQSVYHLMRHCIHHTGGEFTHKILAGYLQVMCYYGYQWLTENESRQPNKETPDRQHVIFNRFISLVEKHYATERKINFYADKLCLTPKYLSNVVYQASGRHAKDWIRDYIILESKALLKSGRYTAQQVGDLLNFPNASFFGKFFKAAVGCPPKEYMRK